MPLPFIIAAVLTLAGAVAAMSLRNLVHCALCLIVTFAGLAALFLQLNAQFVGFAQILVYIGAVAILILFAILLTRSSEMRKIQAPDERGTNPASESSPSPPPEERAGERRPSSPVLPFVDRTQAPDAPSMKPANATGSSPSPPLEERAGERRPSPWSWWMGIAVSLVTFGSLVGAVLSSAILKQSTPRPPTVTVKEIGATLMERYVLPLEVIGLLLTAAMVGAALIAMREKNPSTGWTRHEASERVSSLSSPGGEGRGEEAVSSGRRDRL